LVLQTYITCRAAYWPGRKKLIQLYKYIKSWVKN
jgi:hypothetical protein